jgi:hypothetical protein
MARFSRVTAVLSETAKESTEISCDCNQIFANSAYLIIGIEQLW